MAPTGKQIELPSMFIHRMETGKAAESRGFAGAISIFEQIKAAIANE